MFNAVQKEMAERFDKMKKYAGINIITRKLICGNCGGSMRRVVVHSADKYRGHRYRCFNRYESTRECDIRIIKEEYIKDEFVKSVNEVIKNKKGIIEEAKAILESLNNIDELKEMLIKKYERFGFFIDKMGDFLYN